MWRVLAAVALTLAAGIGEAAAFDDKSWPDDVTVGKADAPNTIVEYFSLDCPHCARFEAEVYPRLKTEWIDTGKAKLVMRDFPLHDVAMAAAMIAHCSGDRYMAYVAAFFETQATWAAAKDPLAAIKVVARLGGMDGAAVDACLGNSNMMQDITARQTYAANTYKIDSTPSFLINGTLAVGEKSYDDFVKLLKGG